MKHILWPLLVALSLLGGCDSENSTPVTVWENTGECSLHESACTLSHDGQSITLKISPHPIPIARPLGVELYAENLSITSAKLNISGLNMYMGYNRVNFQKAVPPTESAKDEQSTIQTGENWVGTTMLAFCTQDKMDWRVTVMMTLEDGEKIEVPFLLSTTNELNGNL